MTINDTKHKRILILGWSKFPFGSAAASRLRLFAKSFLENGASVKIITRSRIVFRPEDYRVNSVFEWNGIRYESTNGYEVPGKKYSLSTRMLNHLIAIFRSCIKVYQILSRGECTAVYVYGRSVFNFPVAFIASRFRLPVIYDICEWFPASSFRGGIFNPFYINDYLGRKLPCFIGNGVVAITSLIKEKYDRMNVPCILIPSVYDSENLPTGKDLKLEKHKNRNFILIYAGSCKTGDGFENLLQAVKRVVSMGYSVTLKVIGSDGRSGWALKHRQTCENDDLLQKVVSFLGWVTDEEYSNVLKRANCLVLPRLDCQATRAAFPNRLPEFLATGRPVLTTNVPDVTRYLTPKVHAEIVDNADALAFGIIRLLKDPDRSRKIGIAGQLRCREVFDYRLYMNALVRFLDIQKNSTGKNNSLT